MRMAARTDGNQLQIVKALRKAGCSIQHLHYLGRGTPDLLAGFNGKNWLLEVKDGAKCPSRRRLTADEQQWHQEWRGQIAVVTTIGEALELVGAYPTPQEKELITHEVL